MSATATVTDVLGGTARWCVVEGDCAAVTRSLPDARFDAIVTDPPSGIAFMGAAWDRDKGGRLQWAAWLAGILSDARRATRDGGRALVWSLPRTSHWTGCAVEDAGWSIETTVAHLFGTGWPKGKAQTKPAQETWWLARTGRSEALNIEACRVTAGGPSPSIARREIAARTGNTPSGKTGPTGWENRNSAEHYTAPREGELAGRYPPNLVISHADGCVCEGTRRVAGGNDPRRADGTRAASPTFTGLAAHAATHAGYADPDGTESVDAWRCVEARTLRVPLFAVGTQRPSSPSREPELLLGLLRSALRGWSASSTSDTVLSHGASAPDDIARIRSVEASDDSGDAAARALGLSELPDSQGGYRFSLRSDDALAREVAAAFRASPQQLFGALCRACSALSELGHTQENPPSDLPTSSRDSRQTETSTSTPESRTSGGLDLTGCEAGTPPRTGGTSSAVRTRPAPRRGTRESSTREPRGTTGTVAGSVRTESDEILLASWCLYVLSVASPETVSHRWIDINLGGCPVAELDRQSGERTSGVKVGGQYSPGRGYNNGLTHDSAACYGDTGTASRYFPQFPADPDDTPWSEALFRYVAKPSRAERNSGGVDNIHSTVKSVALMRWLLRLVTKRGDVILDPFGGSGTTGVAALLEGRRVVLIEREPEYAAITRARLAAAESGADWRAPASQPSLFAGAL